MSAASTQTFAEAIDLWGRLARAANFALDHWWLWPLLLFLLWAVLKVRSQHALLGQLDERADAAFGDVDALLVERHNLIGNLVTIVRAFANKEHEVIKDVLLARVDALEAIQANGIHVDTQIAHQLQNLFTVSENFPTLASESHYRGLRGDLIRIEEKITAARKFYNLAVEEMNGVRRSFPASLIAWKWPLPEREKFTLGARRAELSEPAQVVL
jgi:LemA protein